MSNETLNALLDAQLEDLADLPEFKVFPPGTHRVSVTFGTKEINQHPAVEMKMKMIDTVELANVSDETPAPGDECGVAFMLDNEFGQGNLKQVMLPLAAACGTGSIGETIQAANGMEVTVTTGLRADKNDKDKKYMSIKSLMVD